MPPVGFEPTISAGERSQTHALELAATGTGRVRSIGTIKELYYGQIQYGAATAHTLILDKRFEQKPH